MDWSRHSKYLKYQISNEELPRVSDTRILETGASKECWGAMLKVKRENKEYIVGYKSSDFNNAQQKYYVDGQEILVVLKGTENFESHLISHKFFVGQIVRIFSIMYKIYWRELPILKVEWLIKLCKI